MPGLLLDLVLGFGIGLSLGLLGGGGSILTVPALVYLVGQAPQAAVVTSLAIVGTNSLVGAVFHHRQSKSLNWKVAFLFGGTGMVAAYSAAGLSKQFSPVWLLISFAVLMIAVGSLMYFQKERTDEWIQETPKWWVSLITGAGVGLLTGVLGVGGGFLIVPALVMLVGLPMDQAVATSLVIIAANSLAGLLGHLSAGMFDVGLTLIFVIAGIAGTLAGTRLAHRLPPQRLRKIFALFVVILGIFLLIDNLSKL